MVECGAKVPSNYQLVFRRGRPMCLPDNALLGAFGRIQCAPTLAED